MHGVIPEGPDAKSELIGALRRHVWTLSAEIGERSGLRGDGLQRAERYLLQALRATGLGVAEQAYEFRGRRVANLIAELPGGAPASAPYVIGAHYDTVIGTPGADDNASAVAVLLELARLAAARPPGIALRFVAFTLEEAPAFASELQGSRVFLRRLLHSGESVAGAIVLEMVGMTTPRQSYPAVLRWAGYPEAGDFIAVVANRASRDFGRRVIEAMRGNPALPVESLFVWLDGHFLPDTRLSDHSSFWDQGIPALMVTDTAYFRNPHYHGPGDRPETLDYDFMAELVRSLGLALEALGAGRSRKSNRTPGPGARP